MDRTNAPGHVNHLFVAEDPATNRPPTEITAQDMNAHQEELINIILAAQMAPDGANNAQVIAALNAMFAKISGATGLIRTLTPAGGARIRELGDIANAATVGGIEFGISYNCFIDPATGVWAGRDVADICWLEKWTDAGGIKEFWYAQNAAAGAVPAWVKVFSLDMVNGTLSLGSAGTSAAHAARVDQLPAPYRNRIINGDMAVSQVNGVAAVTPTGAGNNNYVIDQWCAIHSVGSKLTYQQVADAPAGFKYSLKASVAAQYAPGAGDYFVLRQPIEGQNIVDLGFGTANTRRISTGLYIKGSVAGIYGVSIQNAAGNRSYVGTIAVTNAWSPVVVTLDADSAGVWATDNTAGLWLIIDMGSGANFDGAAGAWQAGNYFRTAGCVKFVNQVNGSTLNITGVQLEKVAAGATVGTEFEFIPYSEQLRRCQRYLPVYVQNSVAGAFGQARSATSTSFFIPFMVEARVPPTGLLVVSNGGGFQVTNNSGTQVASTNPAFNTGSVNGAKIDAGGSGLTAGSASEITNTCTIAFTGAQL